MTIRAILACLLLVGSSIADEIRQNCVPGEHNFENLSPKPDPRAPDHFIVTWTTTVSDTPLVVEVFREWSPLGADRFYQLVMDNFYNCATFFRVVPDFVVQFGLASEPELTAKWNKVITDDPVKQSNLEGYLTYATAGADTRTSQLFINLSDNQSLDEQGFSAFGKVISGYIDVARQVTDPTPNTSGGVNQQKIESEGNKWVLEHHPKIDMILTTNVIVPGAHGDDDDKPDEDGFFPAGPHASVIKMMNVATSQSAMLLSTIIVEVFFGFVIWYRR